jgi:hypothetical protein
VVVVLNYLNCLIYSKLQKKENQKNKEVVDDKPIYIKILNNKLAVDDLMLK